MLKVFASRTSLRKTDVERHGFTGADANGSTEGGKAILPNLHFMIACAKLDQHRPGSLRCRPLLPVDVDDRVFRLHPDRQAAERTLLPVVSRLPWTAGCRPPGCLALRPAGTLRARTGTFAGG